MQNYIHFLEDMIQQEETFSQSFQREVLDKISFFQHERLIHLLVTIAFALFTFLFMTLGMLSYLFLIPFVLLLVFLLFYIVHYFYLENNVQYLYQLYDKILIKRIG